MEGRSGIGWLSSSSAEIARARDVLKSLTPGGVIDELGFLILQGAFADRFYPAITTPMTRARYLVFVPAVYRYLERSGWAVGKDADRISRDLQFKLLEALLVNEPTAIGKESGRKIVRTPSEIYWNALGTLGIAIQRVSESSYQRRLSVGAFRPQVLKDDDACAHPGDDESIWDPSLRLSHIMAGGEFPTNTDFRLRKPEAVFLRSRYSSIGSGESRSLMSHLISLAVARNLSSLDGIDYVWDIPDLPPESAFAAEHARRLSLFARGTTLQYHRMLIEKRKESDPGAGLAFDSWWNIARDDLASWDLDSFFLLIQRWQANRRPLHDRAFLTEWIGRCVAGRSGQAVLNDSVARSIIGKREDYVRPGKQRLRVKYQLDTWRLLPSYKLDDYYQLQYRHPVGRQFAQDIAQGLERGAA